MCDMCRNSRSSLSSHMQNFVCFFTHSSNVSSGWLIAKKEANSGCRLNNLGNKRSVIWILSDNIYMYHNDVARYRNLWSFHQSRHAAHYHCETSHLKVARLVWRHSHISRTEGTTCEAYEGLKSQKDFLHAVSFFSTATMVSCRAFLLSLSIIALALSESDRKERFCNFKQIYLHNLASILTLYFCILVSVFNIVKFPNDACDAGSKNGTCYTK